METFIFIWFTGVVFFLVAAAITGDAFVDDAIWIYLLLWPVFAVKYGIIGIWWVVTHAPLIATTIGNKIGDIFTSIITEIKR